MTLQSAIDGELPFLRTEAEARMTDTCRITKPGAGDPVFNEETGQLADPAPVVVYQGVCRIPRRSSSSTSVAVAGEAAWQVGEYPLALPVADTEGIRVGHTVTYLAADDSALVGNVYGITDAADQSHAVERRFRMKRVVGGGS